MNNLIELSDSELTSIEGGKAEAILTAAGFCASNPLGYGMALFLWGVYNGYND
jgi:bacteriocin-like protein